jgi:hypothetical protein
MKPVSVLCGRIPYYFYRNTIDCRPVTVKDSRMVIN